MVATTSAEMEGGETPNKNAAANNASRRSRRNAGTASDTTANKTGDARQGVRRPLNLESDHAHSNGGTTSASSEYGNDEPLGGSITGKENIAPPVSAVGSLQLMLTPLASSRIQAGLKAQSFIFPL